MNVVLLNLICMLFSIICYFLYLIYNKTVCKKEKEIFLDLTLFSSYYLIIKFCDLSFMTSFFINIPIFLALIKKRYITGALLSFLTSLSLSNIYSINFILFLIIYLLIILLSILTKYKVINIFVLLELLFSLWIFILVPGYFNINNLIKLLFIVVIMYAMFSLFSKIFVKIEDCARLYYSFKEIEKEKRLYESLFKITHEIKNPLAVCKGYLDMFDIKNTKKANKYIGIISQEIERTLILLKDFSNISKLNVKKDVMDITMLLDDVCDEVSLMFKGNISFNYVLNNDEVMINGDYDRLKQVFINILKNAKEACIENKNGAIILYTKKKKDNYIIYIKDNGIGMDKDMLEKIGKPFYTTKKDGTGLGVCFSKEIITKHNGTIEYFSNYKNGCKVKITLPINKTSTN